ncbi:MAG: N-acetyl sugar amidotransferase [Phycisphaerae bacterium]
MRYCKRCVYPEVAVNIILDQEGVCSACRVAEEFAKLTPAFWQERELKFREIIDWARSRQHGNYHCIIAVSGGKDSYWQTYLIKEVYNLNPLLVTYHGNNYLPEGQGNLDRMRSVFGVDHIVYGPSIQTLKKLNRLCFKKMGDMNWHAHTGIKIVPMQIACRFNIPLVVWGETTWSIAGMFSPDDYVEYNKRTVLEHDLRGFSWRDMIGEEEGLTEDDLLWARMPGDEELERVGVRGIYIGNFFNWDPNRHASLMHEKFGFEFARQPFDRTYRVMSNLDDMHENGLHDYMKYVKFGYGRASDHASKDIRSGDMTREQGIEMVRQYDHVKPRDLQRWLEYVNMTEEEFDSLADTFRDPRAWRKENGQWVKDNIWDREPAAVG